MRIGIPKETAFEEKRVGIAPAGVDQLVKAGHKVYIESNAGIGSHFSNEEYQKMGAQLVYSSEEIYQRSEMIVKVAPPSENEAEMFEENQILFSFLNISLSKQKVMQLFINKRITSINYELIEKEDHFPVSQSMSEIAGQLAVQLGENYLSSDFESGRGILLGGITGVAPAAIVILGAGVVGLNAAKAALGRGAQVIVLDKELSRLHRLESLASSHLTTVVANPYTISRGVKFADILITAIKVQGEKAPHVITEEMVKTMKKGAVIVDVSIDQGGAVETSRPTSHSHPVFIKHGVIHYCVPNIPSLVSRTASYGLTNSALEFILSVADNGLINALDQKKGLMNAVFTHSGYCSNNAVASVFNLEYKKINISAEN